MISRLREFIRRLRGRCDWDCGRLSTWKLTTRCGCETYLCEPHATESLGHWMDAPRWHCVECDAHGIGSIVKGMETL